MVDDGDEVELRALRDEFTHMGGVGPLLYGEVNAAVRRAVGRGRYPVHYSPTGRWDDDAYQDLAHTWLIQRLIPKDHMRDLLATKDSVEAVRKGLDRYFRHFLIDQRERTALDNLFDRADDVLRTDPRFRALGHARKRAEQVWGLASWPGTDPYDGPAADVVAVARAVPFEVVRYRADAAKESHLVSRGDLARLLEGTLAGVGRALTLGQFATMFRYLFAFALDDAHPVSLDAPLTGREHEAGELRVGDTQATPETTEEIVVRRELAVSVERIARGLSPRQQHVVAAGAEEGATMRSIAARVRTSRGTVFNDLKHFEELVRQEAALLQRETPRGQVTEDEIVSLYRGLLERVAPAADDHGHRRRDASVSA